MKTQNNRKKDDHLKKKPNEKQYKVVNWSITGLFIVFILYMTIGQNPDFLWKLQDLDLFVYNSSFFLDSILRIGGLSMYIGSFLYQFFYYPLAGSLLLLFLLLLVALLTAKTFNLKGWSYPLAFIPSLALLWCMSELGYLIYFQKINGYIYDTIIGVIIIVTGLMIFQKINKPTAKLLFVIAYLFIAYPISGAYSLFGGFLMFLVSLKQYIENKQLLSLIPAIALLPSLVLIPIFYYRFVFNQVAFSDIYITNLPDYLLEGAEFKLWSPFLIMVVFFICLVLWKREKDLQKQTLLAKVVPLTAFLVCMTVVFAFSYKDENFNTEISMQAAADNEDWNNVLSIARNQQDEPTRLIVMITNLALYKLGLEGDKMFHYKNGNKKTNSPIAVVPVHIAGTMMYYQYGLSTYCSKWCMEGMVEYGLNASVLKYFVLSSLLNGDSALSKKYNDVLKSTLFYRTWALRHQKYMDHPETIANAQEFKNIIALTAFDDQLDGDYYNMEAFLRNHFSLMQNVPSELTELSVLFNLEIKNDKLFWPRLFRWVKLNPTRKIPVHFQEAALLYADLQKMDISGAPFDNGVVNNFKNFLAMIQQYVNYPEESLKKISYNQFGNTFWHYYFFLSDPEPKREDKKGY